MARPSYLARRGGGGTSCKFGWGNSRLRTSVLRCCVSASEDELNCFAALWQARVEQMLTRHFDDPLLVRIAEWRVAA